MRKTIATFASCLFLAACGEPGKPPARRPARRGRRLRRRKSMSSPSAPGTATLTQELPGRLQALRTAQVRARVEGIVEKRLFAEGTRCQGRRDPVPHRSAHLPGGFRCGQGGLGRRPPDAGALPAAARNQGGEPAGIRSGRGQGQAGRSGAGARQARPGKHHRAGADFRPHRPRAGDRRRAGRQGRGDAAGHHRADRPDLRRISPSPAPTCCACSRR